MRPSVVEDSVLAEVKGKLTYHAVCLATMSDPRRRGSEIAGVSTGCLHPPLPFLGLPMIDWTSTKVVYGDLLLSAASETDVAGQRLQQVS